MPTGGVLRALHRHLGLPLPRLEEGRCPGGGHRALVARAVFELSDRQYALLTQDHWYRSDRLWARTGEDPGPGFATRFAEVADWYTDHLAGRVGRVPGTR
ncbi:hypothetical protein [Streptomyces sp. NPDC003393]